MLQDSGMRRWHACCAGCWQAWPAASHPRRSDDSPCFQCPLLRCRERLRAALEEVCGPAGADCISLQLVQDGSVLGAAFLAVAAAQWEAEHGGGASKA